MIEIEQIDDELYKAIHIEKNVIKFTELWNKIKNNEQILNEAIRLTRNKWNSADTVIGLTICETMLINYYDVDKKIYKELINNIYKNTDIARTVINGASNGGYSFLLMSLWNQEIELTEPQKEFAVSEAMYKIGTTYWNELEKKFETELDKKGITDQQNVLIDIDGCKNIIGKKTQLKHFNYILNSLGSTQAHGNGCYDIRYCILKNSNWTTEEKQKLIMDFWVDDEDYADILEEWEWGIINDIVNYQGEYIVSLDKSNLYEYTYQELLAYYNTKKDTDKIWEEINFCRQMHQLRAPYWKINDQKKKIKK